MSPAHAYQLVALCVLPVYPELQLQLRPGHTLACPRLRIALPVCSGYDKCFPLSKDLALAHPQGQEVLQVQGLCDVFQHHTNLIMHRRVRMDKKPYKCWDFQEIQQELAPHHPPWASALPLQ